METQTATEARTEATQSKAKKERRSWTTVLTDAAGARLEARLEKRRDGTWKAFARHVAGQGKQRKVTRGASTTGDERTVRSAHAAIVAQAEKAGWTKREARAGFAARPDSFDLAHLPAPGRKK